MTPKYQTIPEWCAHSGMGRTKVYELIASGDLRAVKLGGRTLVDVHQGLAFMESLPPAEIKMPKKMRNKGFGAAIRRSAA